MIFEQEYQGIQYDKTSSIDPFALIAEVKKHPILYNKQVEEYDNTQSKDQVWELVHAVIFPNYEELSEEIRETIKITVRKRWKSLRDALVKDHRLRGEDPVYRQKKMSPAVKQMQFLTPFIKYPSRKPFESNNSPDYCKLTSETTIDLTYQEDQEDSYDQIDDDGIVNNEALYPAVHLTTSEAGSEDIDWKNGYCVSTQDTNSNQAPLKYVIREVEEPLDGKFTNNVHKRKRSDSEEDLHQKLSELVERYNEESQDEDRMFLLSLLSDFKRVPVSKKLKVKSAIVTALYEALD